MKARLDDSLKNMRRTDPQGLLKHKREDSKTCSIRLSDPINLHDESPRISLEQRILGIIEGEAFKVRPVWSGIVCFVSPLK